MLYQALFISIVFVGLLFFIHKRSIDNEWRVNAFINFIAFVLIFQSGLRNVAVGSDTYAYYNAFERVYELSWTEILNNFKYVYIDGEGKDAGYPLIQKIFQIIVHNYRLFLIAVAIFIFSRIAKLMKYYLNSYSEVFESYLVYLLLFYNFMSITGIRQSLSVSIGIWCYFLIKQKKMCQFLILAIIAFTIHKSAIVLFLFPIILRLSVKTIFKYSMILLAISLIFRSLFVAITREAAGYEVFFEAATPWKLIFLFSFVSILIIYQYVYKDKGSKNSELTKLFLPTIAMIPLLGNDSIFMREVYYFSIFSIILIPKIIERYCGKMYLIKSIICILIIFQSIAISGNYAFMWNDMALGRNYESFYNVNTRGI